MKKLTTLETLHGWHDFLYAAGQGQFSPVRTFGAMMTAAENDSRPAKKVVDECLDTVAENIRRTCESFEIPLWPAVIPQRGAN